MTLNDEAWNARLAAMGFRARHEAVYPGKLLVLRGGSSAANPVDDEAFDPSKEAIFGIAIWGAEAEFKPGMAKVENRPNGKCAPFLATDDHRPSTGIGLVDGWICRANVLRGLRQGTSHNYGGIPLTSHQLTASTAAIEAVVRETAMRMIRSAPKDDRSGLRALARVADTEHPSDAELSAAIEEVIVNASSWDADAVMMRRSQAKPRPRSPRERSGGPATRASQGVYPPGSSSASERLRQRTKEREMAEEKAAREAFEARSMTNAQVVKKLRIMGRLTGGEQLPSAFETAGTYILYAMKNGAFDGHQKIEKYLTAHLDNLKKLPFRDSWSDCSAVLRKEKGLPLKSYLETFSEDCTLCAGFIEAQDKVAGGSKAAMVVQGWTKTELCENFLPKVGESSFDRVRRKADLGRGFKGRRYSREEVRAMLAVADEETPQTAKDMRAAWGPLVR